MGPPVAAVASSRLQTVSVGVVVPGEVLASGVAGLSSWVTAVAAAGLDHVAVGDHVSFRGGRGNDALVVASVIAGLHPTLPIHTAVFLLALRHPVVVARQVATLTSLAPGRLVLGVGAGGDDPHELEVCGIDPASRGSRLDECIAILRPLLDGQSVTFHGRHLTVVDASVLPAPSVPVPLLVGGRSDAAVRRAGRCGDGWLGIWVSPSRFAEGVSTAASAAADAGRPAPTRHAMQVWCGLDEDQDLATAWLTEAMEDFYGVPFERFARWSPAGDPAQVAAALERYVGAGCNCFNLIPRGPDVLEAVAAAGEVRRLLNGAC